MVITLLDPIRLLTEAGVVPTLAPVSGGRRSAAQAVLRLVATALAADNDPDVYADLFRQLDVAQRRTVELPEGDEEKMHVERMLDTVPLSGEPTTSLADCLAEYELFLTRKAWLDDALRVLALGARAYGPSLTLPQCAAYALRAGRLNRLLARWGPAESCYGAAIETARALQDDVLRLRSRLGWGAIYRAQGEFAAAKTTAEVVMREAERLDLCELHALAYWDFGVILRLEGVVGEGLQAAQQASQVLIEAEDRLHALRDVGLAYTAFSAYDDSRKALEAVLDSSVDMLLRTSALIGLMDVESATGDRFAFERRSDEIRRMGSRMPPGMAVAHRYKLGQGLTRFGHCRRAHTVLNDALALARANRLHGWCNEIEGWLDEPMAMAG